MPRGHYTKEGEFIEDSGIQSVALWPVAVKRRWLCPKGHMMYLYPMDLDKPAEYWECTTCNIKITISDRNKAYLEAVEHIKEQYKLKTLTYNRQHRYFVMVSNQWIGRDRVDAQRRDIKPSEQHEILADLVYLLKTKLNIMIDLVGDLFVE